MDGDMNDVFQKLNSILEDKDMSDNLKNILNNFSSSDSTKNSNTNQKSTTDDTTNNSIPEFDINTILKIKKIMDSVNSEKDDPRANLLLSLKPYLGESKKEKVDQYVKFLNFAKILEVLNPMGGDNAKNE